VSDTSAHYQNIVNRLRGWGDKVVVLGGAMGYGNGMSWSNGVPIGHGWHHFVCSLNPDQSYIDGLVEMLRVGYGDLAGGGGVVNWFGDVNGVGYLIGTEPCNHFGRGDTAVRDAVMQDRAPTDIHPGNNDYTGNSWFNGIELQHPGDDTPWPEPLLRIAVDVAAATLLEFGYTANRAIDHDEHTNRKDDMSFMGGRGGNEMRRRTAARMSGNVQPPPQKDWFDMATLDDLRNALKSPDVLAAIAKAVANHPSSATGNAADEQTMEQHLLNAENFAAKAFQGVDKIQRKVGA